MRSHSPTPAGRLSRLASSASFYRKAVRFQHLLTAVEVRGLDEDDNEGVVVVDCRRRKQDSAVCLGPMPCTTATDARVHTWRWRTAGVEPGPDHGPVCAQPGAVGPQDLSVQSSPVPRQDSGLAAGDALKIRIARYVAIPPRQQHNAHTWRIVLDSRRICCLTPY